MESFTNDSGEVVVIAEMDKCRLIHSIAKYAKLTGMNEQLKAEYEPVVKALKGEAMKRLADKEEAE